MLVAQSCPTLCDPMDCSLPGSSVRGIFQARILQWGAIPFSRGSSQPGIKPSSLAQMVDSLPSEPSGKPSKINQMKWRKRIMVRIILSFCYCFVLCVCGGWGWGGYFSGIDRQTLSHWATREALGEVYFSVTR